MNRLLPASAVACPVALSLCGGAAAEAQTHPFNFKDVEFTPADQREPAARAFVAQAIQPGASIQAAKSTLEAAGAYCPAVSGGALHCTHSSMQRHPGEDEQDVIWRIDVQGDAAGRVLAATVVRTVSGL